MKKITLPILFALLAIVTSSAQTSYENLKRAIERVPIVVEGEIIKQFCFQDKRTGDIFTKNYLLPEEIFKGLHSTDTVIFLTPGGRVDDIISTVSHSVQVNLNQTGVFLISQHQGISEFYTISSYIKRLPYDRDNEAYFEGSHENFPSWRILRENIGTICGKDVTIKRITLSDLQTLDIPEFCVKLENASLDIPTQRVSFDVMAKSTIAGLEFARAEIPLKYPTAFLGTNIVLNEKIEASKGIVINTSFYDISLYDVQDDEIVLAITSSCNGGESAFVLGTEYEKIADVTVDVETLGNLGAINPDDFEVEGLAKYFLGGVCQEFVEKCAEGQVPLIACSINGVSVSPLTAGTGSDLIITGSHFTDNPVFTQIVIPDADDDGATNIYLSGVSNHFKLGSGAPSLWTDSNITMHLSSTVNSDNKLSRSIGSGAWEIRPDGNSYLPCQHDIDM